MKINLLVIRTENPEILATQYGLLGLTFEHHKHGNGPYHYASENEGQVFEIYPLTKSMTVADKNLRIGFEIENLEQVIASIKNSTWIINSEIKKTEWGEIAVIQDLDGRKIELKNKEVSH